MASRARVSQWLSGHWYRYEIIDFVRWLLGKYTSGGRGEDPVLPKPRKNYYHNLAILVGLVRTWWLGWERQRRFTCPNLYVNRGRLSVRSAASVVSRVGFLGVRDLQLTVCPTVVFCFDEDARAIRIEVQQQIIVVPKDELGRNRTLSNRTRRIQQLIQRK